MLELAYSNLTEELVTALVHNVAQQRATPGFSPFDPVKIIAPNRNLATFLKHEFARRTGIAANLEFSYLNQFFRHLAQKQGIEIVRRQAVRDLLIARFVTAPPAEVERYLSHAKETDERDRRIFQIADRLSQLFEEYALARPRMIEQWPKQTVIKHPQYIETEQWQRQLWLETIGPDGELSKQANRRTLTQYLSEFQATDVEADTFHIFGLSYVARLYFRAFDELSKRSQLYVYTVNPCMEYWEDVPTGWKLTKRAKKRFEPRHMQQPSLLDDEKQELFSEDNDPPALRLWGRPGRDNIRVLNTLTECDFEPHFRDPLASEKQPEGPQDTLLRRFQHDILVREPVADAPHYDYDDESLRFLACPSIQREVEIVANQIWDLVRTTADTDDPITFNDIAVVINHAERDAYQARIRSVFADTHHIPYNMIDVAATGSRRFVEAVTLLLTLPFGRFTRTEFLRLLTHPNVLAGVDEGDREMWVRWCEELNILHGADASDHKDSYIDQPLYHWDQGLQRLVLGGFMTSGDEFDPNLFALDGQTLIPQELGTQEHEQAMGFVLLARSLIHDAHFIRGETMTMSAWLQLIRDLIATYLHAQDDQDEFDRMRVLERVEELMESSADGPELNYRFALEAVLESIQALEVSRGHYLADGVAVSSFLPMRPIPFRVVFVTGMGEKYFPRPDLRSPLDLRWAESLVWDNFSARRQDEYMFLETLISTRDRFYVSWVARDPHTGEELQPSSVIRELRFMLGRHYISQEELDRRTLRHPLRRFNATYRDDDALGPLYQDEALQEIRVSELREQTLQDYPGLPENLTELSRRLSKDQWTALANALDLITPPPAEARSLDVIEVPISAIRKFIETPLQGSAQFYLRMRDEEVVDPFDREDEFFELPTRQRLRLLQRVFLDALTQEPLAFADIYDRFTGVLEQKGAFPTGLFKAAERHNHLELMDVWYNNLPALGLNPQALKTFNFGRSSKRGGNVVRREPLSLDIEGPHEPIRVQIVGSTGAVSLENRAALQFTTSEKLGVRWFEEFLHMRTFIDYVVLVAAGEADGSDFRCVMNGHRRPYQKRDILRMTELKQADAVVWLTAVLQDMLSGVHAYLLPQEGVFKYRLSRNLRLDEVVDAMKNETYAQHSFTRGPVRHPERFDVPANAEALINRRFGLYFDRKDESRSN